MSVLKLTTDWGYKWFKIKTCIYRLVNTTFIALATGPRYFHSFYLNRLFSRQLLYPNKPEFKSRPPSCEKICQIGKMGYSVKLTKLPSLFNFCKNNYQPLIWFEFLTRSNIVEISMSARNAHVRGCWTIRQIVLNFFSTSLPLASTRWVRLTSSSLCQLF